MSFRMSVGAVRIAVAMTTCGASCALALALGCGPAAKGAGTPGEAHAVASPSAPAPASAGPSDNEVRERMAAARPTRWARASVGAPWATHVKVLGINDLHGQISAGRVVAGRPVGGAAAVASYLRDAMRGMEDRTVLVHAGDLVGASPPASALLQDEPTISFLNSLGNGACSSSDRLNSGCNLVGTLGNHEFDEGQDELKRLLTGGNHPRGPFLEDPWRGASFPTISANVVDRSTLAPWTDPFVVKKVAGIRIGFIGAMLKEAPASMLPRHVAGLEFREEAGAVNRYAAILRSQGVRTIVLLIHQGGQSEFQPGLGATDRTSGALAGPIVDIVGRLDPGVDLVISGHTHQGANGLVKNRAGADVLVTEAFSYGTAFDDVDMEIDRRTGEAASMLARVVTTWADEGPGLAPDPRAAALVASAEARVGPRIHRVVGAAAAKLTGKPGATGESALGVVIAEAHRACVHADFGLTNPGGVRADLPSGPLTWGDLFAVQPFMDTVVKLAMRGQQIYDVLNQQWQGRSSPRLLQVAGLEYTWSARRPDGDHVVEVRKDGRPIDRAASYTVAVNKYLAGGGDGFAAFVSAGQVEEGPLDVDALAAYIESQKRPIANSCPEHIHGVP